MSTGIPRSNPRTSIPLEQYASNGIQRRSHSFEGDSDMVDEVCGFFGGTTSINVSARSNDLGGFLPDLFQAKVAIGQQHPGVAGAIRLLSSRPDGFREP